MHAITAPNTCDLHVPGVPFLTEKPEMQRNPTSSEDAKHPVYCTKTYSSHHLQVAAPKVIAEDIIKKYMCVLAPCQL
jgi:hypothetical protein